MVALILPLYALGGQARYRALWSVTPPQAVIVIPWRMEHAQGTSHFNHTWCIWDQRQHTNTTQLIWAKGLNDA